MARNLSVANAVTAQMRVRKRAFSRRSGIRPQGQVIGRTLEDQVEEALLRGPIHLRLVCIGKSLHVFVSILRVFRDNRAETAQNCPVNVRLRVVRGAKPVVGPQMAANRLEELGRKLTTVVRQQLRRGTVR